MGEGKSKALPGYCLRKYEKKESKRNPDFFGKVVF